MEKKYLIKDTGEPVQIGDTVEKKVKKKASFGTITTVQRYLVTEALLPTLIKIGIIAEAEEEKPTQKSESHDLTHYLNSLADLLGIGISSTTSVLNALNKLNPGIVMSTLLGVIAHEKYPEGINLNLVEKVWHVNLLDGGVYPIELECLNRGEFPEFLPLFASEKDAQEALMVVDEQYQMMYGE